MVFIPNITTNTYRLNPQKKDIDVLILDVHGTLGASSDDLLADLKQKNNK